MNADIINVLKTIVPGIATVLCGPLAGAATSWLANKLGASAETTAAVSDAIQGIDPLKRQELEQEFTKWYIETSQKEIEMYLADTQNARQRDVELAKSGIKNNRANFIVAVTFIGILSCVALAVWQSTLTEFAKGAINIVLGILLADWKQITNFEFGSSKSSQVKDETISNLSKG